MREYDIWFEIHRFYPGELGEPGFWRRVNDYGTLEEAETAMGHLVAYGIGQDYKIRKMKGLS